MDPIPHPEVQAEILSAASKSVSDLYMGDNMGRLLGESSDERDTRWDEGLAKLPDFRGPALRLKQATDAGVGVLNGYPDPDALRTVTAMEFPAEEIAGSLLADVCYSRMPESGIAVEMLRAEVVAMKAELGVEASISEELSLNQVVAKVLQGDLRVGRAPEPEKST